MKGQDGTLLRSIRTLFGEGTTGSLTDAQLLGRFLSRRDEMAFEALVVRHGPMVFDVCRNHLSNLPDAEDAFQATFLILATRARSIRQRESLGSWLFGVARRVASRAKLEARRRHTHERQAALNMAARVEGDEKRQDVSTLYEEVDNLPEKYREAVVLCYLEELTHAAAAERLRCPVGTVSVRLMRAKERLKTRLARRGLRIFAGIASKKSLAALPDSLVKSTADAALAASTTRGLAGVASASVAQMAAGALHALRWKAIGAWCVAAGLIALTSSACLALRTTAKEPESQETKREAEEESKAKTNASEPWIKRLSDGTIVELVGVSSNPSGPETWWTPDGQPLAQAPYARTKARASADANQQAREFAVRVTTPAQVTATFDHNPAVLHVARRLEAARERVNALRRLIRNPNDPSFRYARKQVTELESQLEQLRRPTFPDLSSRNFAEREPEERWKILPVGSSVSGLPLDREGREIPNLKVIAMAMPKDQVTCQVSFGAPSSRWKTVATSGPSGVSAQGIHGEKVIFGAAHESSGVTKITVSSNSSEADARVVAMDDEDDKYPPIRIRALGTGGFQQLEVEFAIPLSQIKELRFQTRPFQWAEFTNVALNPLEEHEVK